MNRLRAVLLTAGVLVIGYALLGSIAQLGGKVGGILIFLVAVLIAHDGVWLPLVLLTGSLLDRVVPARRRPLVRVAAVVAAAVTMAALPLALGFGRTADNPSALPLDYGRNLLLVLLGIAAVTGLALLAGRWRDRNETTRSSGGKRR